MLEIDSNAQLEQTNSMLDSAILGPAAVPVPEEVNGKDLYLIGRPELKDFLRYVKSHAVHPPAESELIAEWEAAHHVVRRLEKTEAGIADRPPITKIAINEKTEPFFTEFLKDPLVRNGFNTVPTEVAMVELDRMVVYQKHIDLAHVRQLKMKFGPSPTQEELFRICLPYDHPHPPVKWSRMHGDTFVFMSPSNDIRYLGTMRLEAKHIKDYPPPGSLVAVIGIAIGFGSNFLNAVYYKDRLILNNGSHRAYALRDLGVTHVPCIVQHISSLDQLDVVAASDIADDPEYFFDDARPAMLRDYFNPELRKVMEVRREHRQITVKFDVDEGNVPAF